MGRIVFLFEYAMLRTLVMVAAILPFESAIQLSGDLWCAVAPRLSRHRRADRHLSAMMPELSAERRREILLGMWRNLGETFMESLMLKRIAAEPGRIECDANAERALQRTRDEGAIIACPHLGNWEVSPIPLAAIGGKHSAVYRRMKNPYVEAYVMSIRAPFYQGGLVEKSDGAARGLVARARSGGSIGVMSDLRDDGGCAVPFFGALAPSTTLPAMLARQFRRPLFAICVARLAPARFRLHVCEVDIDFTKDRAGDIQKATATLQYIFETWIRQWPDQWMWAHQRYRK